MLPLAYTLTALAEPPLPPEPPTEAPSVIGCPEEETVPVYDLVDPPLPPPPPMLWAKMPYAYEPLT